MITRTEILVGIEEAQELLVKAFLDQFFLFAIDKPIADQAASLRKQYGLKLPDAFQAALALYHRVKLATRNIRDFNLKKFDFIEIPYTLG